MPVSASGAIVSIMRLLAVFALAVSATLAACGSDGGSSSTSDGGGVGNDASSEEGGGGDDGSSAVDGAAANDAAPPRDGGGGSGNDAGGGTQGVPPFGGSSGGSGGAVTLAGAIETASGITYRLIVPSSPTKPAPLLVVYSGTEGGSAMAQNLMSVGPSTATDGFIRAVLDGVTYSGNANAGATVLDDVRAKYDVDNDRTYLLGESAGTTAALKLGFHVRQSYFAAYWANDVNATDTPGANATQLGFAPWGQVGPGGDLIDANTLVSAMRAAGYRLPTPAPYNGAGAGTHGDPSQFVAAVTFFPGKTRK